jgi:predicted MFS family arabinose efflux permease
MHRWSIVAVVYFCSVVACLNQFKVPPVTGMLIQQFHVNEAMVGWMMSIFSLTGILFAFPAAVLLRRIGPTRGGLTALSCIILGCIVGGTAGSASVLMTGRVIEGVGLSLIGVIAPAVIAMYFKHEEIGLPMGIWATWFPVGSTLGYDITHPVTNAFGSWRGIWWVGAALAAVAFILYAPIVKRPSHGQNHHQRDAAGISFSEGLRNAKIWSLGFVFFFLMLGSLGFLTWSPHYFAEAFKLNRGIANFYASLGFLSSAPGGIIAGIVLTKWMSQRSRIILICASLALITYPFAFILPQSFMIPFLLIIGFITGFTCATIFAIVPKVMASPALAGLGISVVIFMQSWANLLATPSMGFIIAGGKYSRAVIPTAVVQVLGLIAAIAFHRIKERDLPTNHDQIPASAGSTK